MNWTEETIDFASLSQSEIKSKLNSLNIALSVDEILKVQNEILMRPPPHTHRVCALVYSGLRALLIQELSALSETICD